MKSDEDAPRKEHGRRGKFTSLEALLESIPANLAWEITACPVENREDETVLAIWDGSGQDVQSDLEGFTNAPVELTLKSEDEVLAELVKRYPKPQPDFSSAQNPWEVLLTALPLKAMLEKGLIPLAWEGKHLLIAAQQMLSPEAKRDLVRTARLAVEVKIVSKEGLLEACPEPLRPLMVSALSQEALPPPVGMNLALVFQRVNPFRWLSYRAAPFRQEHGILYVLTDPALKESHIHELSQGTRWPIVPVDAASEVVTAQLLACAMAPRVPVLFADWEAKPGPLEWPGVEDNFLVPKGAPLPMGRLLATRSMGGVSRPGHWRYGGPLLPLPGRRHPCRNR